MKPYIIRFKKLEEWTHGKPNPTRVITNVKDDYFKKAKEMLYAALSKFS